MQWISPWYLFLYFLMLAGCVLSAIFKSNSAILICTFFLVLFSGLRYGVGIDFFSYYTMILSSYHIDYIEPISRYILLFARDIKLPGFYFFINSLIYILGICYGLSKFRSYNTLSFFVFVFFVASFLTSFGFVRQFTATALIFIGFYYLYKDKIFYYIFFVILASLIHFSAIIFICFVILRKFILINYKSIFYFLVVPSSFMFTDVFIYLSVQFDFYSSYIVKYSDPARVFGQKIYYSLVVVTLLFFCFRSFILRLKRPSSLLVFSQNMVFICLFIYGAFLPFGEHVARICYYIIPFYYIWFSEIFSSICRKELKVIYLVVIIFICTFYYFSTLYYAQFSSRGDFLNNYQLIFLT